jgi:hypothetical protein
MTRFLMLVLADEQSHAHWKEELKKLVAVTETKNAIDLQWQVMQAMTRTAATIKDATFTASHGLLWRMKAGADKTHLGASS